MDNLPSPLDRVNADWVSRTEDFFRAKPSARDWEPITNFINSTLKSLNPKNKPKAPRVVELQDTNTEGVNLPAETEVIANEVTRQFLGILKSYIGKLDEEFDDDGSTRGRSIDSVLSQPIGQYGGTVDLEGRFTPEFNVVPNVINWEWMLPLSIRAELKQIEDRILKVMEELRVTYEVDDEAIKGSLHSILYGLNRLFLLKNGYYVRAKEAQLASIHDFFRDNSLADQGYIFGLKRDTPTNLRKGYEYQFKDSTFLETNSAVHFAKYVDGSLNEVVFVEVIPATEQDQWGTHQEIDLSNKRAVKDGMSSAGYDEILDNLLNLANSCEGCTPRWVRLYV